MSESYIQVPTDGKGKKIRTIKKTVGENEVHMEGVVPFDETGEALFAEEGTGRKALREELDVQLGFTWEKFLCEGLDPHFVAGKEAWPVGGARQPEKSALPSEFWVQESAAPPDFPGYVKKPADYYLIYIQSRKAYKYPIVSFRTKLISGITAHIGFEDGRGFGSGLADFFFYYAGGVYVSIRSRFVVESQVEITPLVPDYLTVKHVYTVEHSGSMVFFTVDGNVVAVGIPLGHGSIQTINGPPYYIFSIPTMLPSKLNAFIELVGGENREYVLPLAPLWFRVIDGDRNPPRLFRLYETGTNNLLAGSSISSGSITSHPIPIFGYSNKTLFFQANKGGTLNIEFLMQTGNWRTYDSASVSANTLLAYTMTGDAVLARVTFTPSTYPATINDAEVVLS